MEKELLLKEYGGQKCDLILHERKDGSKYAKFDTVAGYGSHYYNVEQLQDIVDRLENL